MKARVLTLVAVSCFLAVGAFAAPNGSSMEFTPITCIKGGELPLMQLDIEGEGELRSYFRRLNTTDWCSVIGTNEGPLSRVVLPKFEAGDEIEYFFVLIKGREVVARSPRIYRASVNAECGTAFARHVMRLSLNCGPDAQTLPRALTAGYAMNETLVVPPPVSPDSPENQ